MALPPATWAAPAPPAVAKAPTPAECGNWAVHMLHEMMSPDPPAVIGAHVQQSIAVITQGVGGVAAPAWFMPAIAGALAPINARLDQLSAQLLRMEARSVNYKVIFADVAGQNLPLSPLPLVAPVGANPIGALPGPAGVYFPATANEVNSLTEVQLNALAAFYGVLFDGPTVGDRRTAFRSFVALV
eukprot:TRINITY_DN15802_c0_g1_i1.p1 TRINITY_DN15802_c0_g1~~TRINITY_DN15802_c0_g1_i1.p1  ORF type:complete len:186 (+),score=35.50 TRINITY_DN15802_c0_g1_i1:37-594(+)